MQLRHDGRGTIDLLVAGVRAILGENCVGVYFHGSLCLGCFNPDHSDVDSIIVVEHRMAAHTKTAIVDFLVENESRAPKKGFEMSVVLAETAKHFT